MSATPPQAPIPVVVTNPAPAAADVKPGWATTEWWTNLIAQAVALLTLFHPGLPTEQWTPIAQAVAVLGSAIAAGFYAHSRGTVKAAATEATKP